VPLQVPEVIVPTVFKLANDVSVEFEVAVMFPAVVAVVALPKKFGAVTSLLNVFAPLIVCVPVEIKPGLVASAAVNVKVVPLIVPPLDDPVVEYAKEETPAVIPTVPAAVNLPFASTVNVGIAVDEPYDPAVTAVFVKVADPVTLDVPSNAPLVYVTSPVVEMVRPVARAVAVLALPVNGPVNPVALIVPLVTTLVTLVLPNCI